MNQSQDLLIELDALKSIYRKSYLSDQSRLENSAEHSWHLAVTFIALAPLLPSELNTNHAIKMALLHDVCEIGAGDQCAYDVTQDKAQKEQDYLEILKARHNQFGSEALAFWQEYEAQETAESHWVKVFDKLLPFLLNLSSEGRTWQEQGIYKEQVLEHNAFINEIAPQLYDWMRNEIERASELGWLAKKRRLALSNY